MMENNIRCYYLIQYKIQKISFEESMQQKEEGHENIGLKEYELFENYFSMTPMCIEKPYVSSIEKYLQRVLSEDDMQLSVLDKYLTSLYAESTFSSPEPFSPPSNLSSQSDIEIAPVETLMPDIKIPEVSEWANTSISSNLSSHSLFDWPVIESIEQVQASSEKKTFISASNIDIVSLVIGLPPAKKASQVVILAGIYFIPKQNYNSRNYSIDEINRRKL